MRCPDCGGSGQVFAGHAELNGEVVDIYNPCTCNPEPRDEDFGDFGYPGETPYPDFTLPVIDFDPGTLPARLLA